MKYIMITNDPAKAQESYDAGINRMMVDLEILNKNKRQKGTNSFISDHKITDVATIRDAAPDAELMVRINHYHPDINVEITDVLNQGADFIMLPYIQSLQEVEQVSLMIGTKASLIPLIETPRSFVKLNEICAVKNVKEVYLGLNDLHLEMKLDFMFEILSGGLVDIFAQTAKQHNLPFGFGGVGAVKAGKISAEYIIAEHARVGSTRAIVGRAFRDNISNYKAALSELNHYYKAALKLSSEAQIKNFENLKSKIAAIANEQQQ